MKKVSFGDTDIQVSRIGLGLAALGRPGYINLGHGQDLNKDYDVAKMEAVTHQMLDESVRLGINYIDVARSYGKGEEFLSSWTGRTDMDTVVGSKWGYYYTADWQVQANKHEIKEHSIGLLNKQWPLSHQLLSPNLKIYHIHSATFESGVLDNHEVLRKLEAIRETGIVIGLSLSGPTQGQVLEKALEIKVGSKPLFGSVQATFNILEQSAEVALMKAYDRGIGVIIKEAVANGRLTERNKQGAYLHKLQKMAETYETTIDAIALAFALSKPFVTTVLSGASTIEQLNSNVQSESLELEKSDIQQLNRLAMEAKDYWQERSSMSWN